MHGSTSPLSALLYLKNLRRTLRLKLPPDALDIAQHPECADLVAAALEKCRAGPADIPAGRRNAEKFGAMPAMKTHSCRHAIVRRDDFFDLAREPFKRA